MAATKANDMRDRKAVVDAVLQETRQDLFRFLARRLRSEHEAADVLQEFYVKVLRSFSDLKDEDKLRPWMSQVLRSVVADHFRARSRRERMQKEYEAELLTAPPDLDPQDADLVVCACLYKILPTLRPEYARVLWRADLLGEDRKDVSASLGLTENAFRVKLHRARQALRRRLEQSCNACRKHHFLDCGCEGVGEAKQRVDQMDM